MERRNFSAATAVNLSTALFRGNVLEERKMYHLTRAGRVINYAVEVRYLDGPYVVCLTQSPEVAQLVSRNERMRDERGGVLLRGAGDPVRSRTGGLAGFSVFT